MKKMLAGIITAAIVITMGTMSVMAAPGQYGPGSGNRSTAVSFTDEDNDGICDRCGKTQGFVDKNGDGICDYGTGTHPQDGTGMRRGAGVRGGNGMGSGCRR